MEFNLHNFMLVLLVAWGAGAVARRCGYPAILGELAAGILFGPALLGIVHGSEGLDVLAELGVFLMMLYIGMEVNYRDLVKASSGGLLAAFGGFTVPLVLGFFVTRSFGYSLEAALFLGLAMGVTSLATKSRILVDLNLLGTRIAHVLFAAALLCDTVALVVFALIMGIVGDGGLEVKQLLLVVVKALLFFGVCIGLGLRLFPVIGRWLQRFGFTERTAGFTMVVLIGLVFAVLAEEAGLHSILGAFLAGMFLREEMLQRKLTHEVTTMVRDVSLGFLAPIFFVTAGFHVDLLVILTDWPLLLLIIGLAAAGKILGAALFYLPTRNGWREGLTIGAGMNGHGAVEIIIAGIALEAGIIDQNLFSILIFMAFVTTSSVPVLMKWGVGVLRRRGALVMADHERAGVLIVGATPLGRLLAREFMSFEPVMMIDSNGRRCAIAEHEGLPVFRGNALSEDVLDIAGADRARMLVSLTVSHEVNTVAASLARDYFAIPHVHAVRHNYHAETPTPVSPREKAAAGDTSSPAHPLFHTGYNLETWNRRIFQNEIELQRFDVEAPCDALDFFAALGPIDIALPLLVIREGTAAMPGSVDRLEEGDKVVAVRHRPAWARDPDPFSALIESAPILDVTEKLTMDDLFFRVAEILGERLGIRPGKIRKMLLERERDSSTVIFPGVAIPHIVVDGKEQSELVVIRCRQGIAFRGDEATVHMLFVLAGTRDRRNRHLKILSSIAQLLQDPTFDERWMAADDEDDLREAIMNTERRTYSAG